MNVIVPAMRTDAAADRVALVERYRAIRHDLPGDLTGRDLAADWLERHGLPTRRVEAWRYTDLRRVWDTRFEDAPAVDPARAAARLEALLSAHGLELDGPGALPQMVFVNGRAWGGCRRDARGRRSPASTRRRRRAIRSSR